MSISLAYIVPSLMISSCPLFHCLVGGGRNLATKSTKSVTVCEWDVNGTVLVFVRRLKRTLSFTLSDAQDWLW